MTVSIARAPQSTYEFIREPRNLPQWAPGFARAVRPSDGKWVVETVDDPVEIDFVAPNPFGVADHRVTAAPGITVVNAVRVVPNGSGSEVIFTFFQTPDMADHEFEAAAALVENDLQTLKRVLEAIERGSRSPTP
ncbi:SRPBCC family protein [Micromonospora sp. NPDC049679]|uniref:SRPBCC family protein n=1 Tax=Micromonospora sp. NPDC049679 TaxID=3155920 RepID=UPI0033F7FC14